MSESLEGRIAVITGAASGIGLAATRGLLDQGAIVVMVDRNRDALNELAADLGEKAVVQVTDMSTTGAITAVTLDAQEVRLTDAHMLPPWTSPPGDNETETEGA